MDDSQTVVSKFLESPFLLIKHQPLTLQVKIAMYGSVIANIVLLALQLYAAISTSSLSIFATMADAVMDLASNIVLIYTSKAAEDHSPHAYPVGKRRMETAGILVFACIMSALSVELLIEAIRTLASSASS